ncbi:MAG: hypothetical protein KC476_07670 [Cyanobacteria bacterium HKST-UBA06]|nr:hypothetical protein [Cyanobacteria bacterium HKST-UBA06]
MSALPQLTIAPPGAKARPAVAAQTGPKALGGLPLTQIGQVAQAAQANPFCRLPHDTVSFGQAPMTPMAPMAPERQSAPPADNRSQAQRLQDVRRQADALLSGAKDGPALIKRFMERYGNQVHLYDGSQADQHWVNDICDHYSTSGFVKAPESVLGLRPASDTSEVNLLAQETAADPHASASAKHYTGKVLPDLHQQGRIGVFLKKGASKGIVMHELYHVLQYLNGVTATSGNLALDHRAETTISDMQKPITGLGWLDPWLQLGKRIGHWAYTVPKLKLKRRGQDAPTDTVGHAIRIKMDLEKDVDRYMLSRPNMVGWGTWVNHLVHAAMESYLTYHLSYQHD